MIKKTVIINRAVPGSGKTTITNCMVDTLKQHDLSVAVYSTDEYFMQNGRYVFDVAKLGGYHQNNLEQFYQSMSNGIEVIICDNTNIAPWQTEAYINNGKRKWVSTSYHYLRSS